MSYTTYMWKLKKLNTWTYLQNRNKLRGIENLWLPRGMSEWVSEVAQSCPTLCNPMDCSLPSSSIHGILQARILEWIAISFSRGSSRPRDWTQVSHIVGRCFTMWATRKVHQEGWGEGKNEEFGINIYPLLYIKYLTNKDLLYSRRNYIQYLVITYNGK